MAISLSTSGHHPYATDLARRIRNKELSAVEVLNAHLAQIERVNPQVNAIICSGYSDEAALSEFLVYGFRGALPKPFTRGDLDQALRRSFTTATRT